MAGSIWAFLGVAIIVIVAPGPDTALTIRNALAGGRTAGIATAGGVALGQLIWALATSLGLAALLLASQTAFALVKLAGAVYLVVIGVQAVLRALRPAGWANRSTGAHVHRSLHAATALRQGVINDLGNPKMAVFFTSLLPQFVPHGNRALAASILLGLAFALMTFAWLTIYASCVAAAGDVLHRPAVRRGLEAVTGGVLIALGLRVAAEARP